MPKKKLSRLSRFFLSAVCLAGAYLLCRFGLFSLHGMKQWPAVLAAAGFAALVAAALYDFWIASSTTIVCYPAGCFLGLWLGKTKRSRRWTNPQWLDYLDNYFCIRNFFRIPYGLDSSKKNISKQRPDFQSGLCFDIWLS